MKVHRSRVIDAPIDDVWAAIRPFDNANVWNPSLDDCYMVSGNPTEIGSVRHIEVPDGTFVETLVGHSDTEHFYSYVIDKSPLAVRNYMAVHGLQPVTDGGQTFSTWTIEFECDLEDADELVDIVGNTICSGGLAALAAHCER